MWEYSISFKREDFKIAKNICDKIKTKTKGLGGVVTLVVESFMVFIVIAIPQNKKEEIKDYILDIIINIYTTKYKLEYLLGNFNFEVTNDINMKAFIKALMVFDLDTDKKIIRQKLLNIDSIVVDSFFHFRLGVLKARWNDLINLANDNIMYLMSKDTFIELIKFLVSNLEFKCDFVSVKQSGKDFKIYDKDGKSLKDELEDCENLNDVFLITTLISLNPRRIRLDTTNNLKDNTMSLLYEIFNNRVEIFK